MKTIIDMLPQDDEGLSTYEFLVNRLADLDDDALESVIDRLAEIDRTGQYLTSASRYLHALDSVGFEKQVNRMVSLIIDRDRERRYLGDLIQAIYGNDYVDHAEELSARDDNFRRIYKRLYPGFKV